MAISNKVKYFTLEIVFLVGIVTLEFIWPAVTFYTELLTQFGASGDEGCPMIYGPETTTSSVSLYHQEICMLLLLNGN